MFHDSLYSFLYTAGVSAHAPGEEPGAGVRLVRLGHTLSSSLPSYPVARTLTFLVKIVRMANLLVKHSDSFLFVCFVVNDEK